jgi:uncharacterized membrane protein
MSIQNVTTLSQRLLDAWVRFRTSMYYIYSITGIVAAWIVINKTGIWAFDNSELTYLNLFLSITADLWAVLILIYLGRMSERDRKVDEETKKNKKTKLDEHDKMLKDINDKLALLLKGHT